MHQIKICNYYKYKMSQEKGYTRLVSHGIKPSLQRIAIMNYLIENTLSRTTVYNTLKILVEQGAVQMLTIDDKNSRYDADITPHAHFRCSKCGCIKDLPIKEDIIFKEDSEKIKITEVQL